MVRLSEICESIKAGGQTSRLTISLDEKDPVYYIYNVDNLNSDLQQAEEKNDLFVSNQLRTTDEVMTAEAGDLVYCLMTKSAAIVQPQHSGFFLSMNFIKLKPSVQINKSFLLFLLNCSEELKKQINRSSGAYAAKRVSLKSLLDTEIEHLPEMKAQEIIGDTYLQQMHLSYLRQRSAALKDEFVIGSLKRSAGIL